MIININGESYRMNKHLLLSAKKVVTSFLDTIRNESANRDFSEYYTAVIIMTYVVTSGILNAMDSREIRSIVDDIEKE